MKSDGQDSHPGEEELDSTANVVHFPRDWFGPREELVPFGPDAGARAGEDMHTDRAGAAGLATPVRAEDFWGEASASIHDAMERPAASAPAAGGRWLTAAIRLPIRRLPPVGGRSRAFVVAGMGCAGCLLAAVFAVWPVGVRSPQSTHETVGLSPAVIEAAAAPIALPSTRVRTSGGRARAREHPGRARRPGSRAVGSDNANGSGTSMSGASVSGTSVSGESTAAPSPPAAEATSTPSSTSASAAPASTSSGTASATTQASPDSGGGGSGQVAGPSGPGAPFGPGHLG